MPPQNSNTTIVPSANHSDNAIEFGRFLASPDSGDEVVISGIAGRFPNSDDLDQFRDNLYNKVDLVSDDNRRWEPTHPEIPQRTGKVNALDRYDPGFFGVHHRQANTLDPMARMLMEHAIEAIFDAGVNPKELKGTKTGVFVGVCFSESEKTWFFDRLESKNYTITGNERSFIPNLISYALKVQGPSFVVDTACSSSLHAFEHAYKAIRSGHCDMAIVGGVNLLLHPYVSLQFARLGVLSKDGACKSFDNSADGYARSETVCAVFLQKAKDCRRSYAQVVHTKINCDGYKPQGITFPSGPVQKTLLDEFYQECKVDPSTLSFIEAHGTGTKVGDPEEISAIEEVFCAGRTEPLLIGSVKSNIGHTEPASGLCSIAKVIIGMENGYIPPNIHYSKPRENVKALQEGRLKVVDDKTPWQDDNGLVGINSFGFGGANCHVLLRWNRKIKQRTVLPNDDIPRLVCVSGRDKAAVASILDGLNKLRFDVELVRLLHEAFKYDIDGHLFRGYAIVSKVGEQSRSIVYASGELKPLCYVFNGYDTKWLTFGRQLFGIPLFAATLQRLNDALSKHDVNIKDLVSYQKQLTPDNGAKEKSGVNDVLVHIAIQLALVDVLKAIDVHPAYVIGQSIGIFAAAYCDGALNLEQSILGAYYVALWHKEVDFNDIKTATNSSSKNLLLNLKQVIPKPKNWSNHYLPSVVLNQTNGLASPEFFLNFLTSPTIMGTVIKRTFNSVLLEFGMATIDGAMKEQMTDVINFNEHANTSATITFLEVLGRLYQIGLNPRLERLYPKVQYPVSRGTPMISPLIKWDHSKEWHLANFKTRDQIKIGEKVINVKPVEQEWAYLSGHVIDGRNLFPATGYLFLVCETLASMMGMVSFDLRVVFENVKFLRATTIPKAAKLELVVMVQRGSGNFEIIEGSSAVVTGKVSMPKDDSEVDACLPEPAGVGEDRCLPMTHKDIYKELKLRGYNYSGLFKSVVECDATASRGLIRWSGNWVAFMDNMLQMQILQADTRNLYVPTGIERMVIDAKKHVAYVLQLGEENPNVPVYVHGASKTIKSGHIEIVGLSATSIARRKPLGEPVLEKYQFVPNRADLTVDQSLRVNMQILLENSVGIKVKAVELVDEETVDETALLGPLIHQVLGDQPLIQPEIVVLSKKSLEVNNATVNDKALGSESDCSVVVATNIASRPLILQEALKALKPKGFVISRERVDFVNTKPVESETEVLTVHRLATETLIMMRKRADTTKIPVVVDVGVNGFDWLTQLQGVLKTDNSVVAYAQDQPLSGVIGLVNCVRREPGGDKVQCVFVVDAGAPRFNPRDDFYKKQLNKNMAINIFKDGAWGTYRHLLLDGVADVEGEHFFANVTSKGDLSSLSWIEGPLDSRSEMEPEQTLVNIYYSALNFRDVMTAMGKIGADAITKDRTQQDCVQGIEFSGRDQSGKRVMGMVTSKALATLLAADSNMVYDVPDNWSMEDAATVPAVYATVLYAFFLRGNLKRGDSVLIHAGSGGVGQAAITVALHTGCTVFTTVGTQEKRDFIKKQFPQLTDRHIGNSRETSFEEMIFTETRGRGVDYVLNSLSEDKLQASVRCLARGGKFLEIGKFDLVSNNPIGLQLFAKEASFHGVMLDGLFVAEPRIKKTLNGLMKEAIKNGSVKPLVRKVFKQTEIEEAFRHMAAGKHIGKVLIQNRKEEKGCKNTKSAICTMKGTPRYYCDPNLCTVIAGGLGGFGLELADWLVLRGCRKLVLTTRNGIQNGYQASRIRIWRSYGTSIKISTADITTKEGCQQLIEEAETLGPVQAVFNLAVVLMDAILENQTVENYLISFGPKAFATKHLDEVTRESCPQLRDFVIYSSVSCGRGNPGQSNYGMANSVMERICEQRKKDGLPALAIEWGAVGEVGLVAEMQEGHGELEIGGTLQQRISSCLETLDIFLTQNEPIVSSMVVAEKRSAFGGADNVIECVASIMGLKNLKSISLHSTLAELGMDSMMAVEIKQSLEREFEVFLTPEDIRGMTFTRLYEIQTELESDDTQSKAPKVEILPQGINLLLQTIGSEETAHEPLIRMPSLVGENAIAPTIFVIPGIEGTFNIFENFSLKIKAHVLCLQICHKDEKNSIKEMALELLPQIERNHDKSRRFVLLAYSYGCTVALELLALLEQKGYFGDVTFVDGSPEFITQLMQQQFETGVDENVFQTTLLCALMMLYMPVEAISKLKTALYQCKTFDERVEVLLEKAPKDIAISKGYQRELAVGLYKSLKAISNYKPSFTRLASKVRLFRPITYNVLDIAEDYKLSDYCEDVHVTFFEGNHITVLDNPKLTEEVNKMVEDANLSGGYVKGSLLGKSKDLKYADEFSIKQI